jgi:DUF971 family protein
MTAIAAMERGMSASTPASELWPTDLTVSADQTGLCIIFDGGETYDLPAEFLRVSSPSAEVQGHSAAERKTVPGKRNVMIKALQAVGNYAVRIVFDDGHDSGLFTWAYLATLGREQESRWKAYLAELAEKGLKRQ